MKTVIFSRVRFTTYDLSTILTDELFKLYSLKDEFGSTNTLYKYLYVKCGLAIDNKKVTNKDLIKFVLEELNIEVFQKESPGAPYVVYDDEEYEIFRVGEDFIDNLEFRADLEGDMDLKSLIKFVYDKGYSKSIKYRKLNYYKTYIKYNRLMTLNEKLGITPLSSPGIEGFKKSANHNPFRRSLEETLKAYIDAERFMGSSTTTYITEEQLEDYLIKNIELIEEGMKYIGRQIEVPGGIIDILAKDKNNNICVIELKIDEDKSIVWQSIHYPKEIKKKYRADKVRMMTIAPSYSKHLLKSLRDIEDVEVLEYSIKVSMDNIEKLAIRKII